MPSVARAWGPLFGDHTGLPPAVAGVGTHDVLLPDTRRYDTEVHEYPGTFHGFVCAPVPKGLDGLDRLGAFVLKHVA